MTTKLDDILEKAKSLTPDELEMLIARLQSALPPPDPDWERAWAEECQRRLAAHDRGEGGARDWDEVMAEMKRKHRLA